MSQLNIGFVFLLAERRDLRHVHRFRCRRLPLRRVGHDRIRALSHHEARDEK